MKINQLTSLALAAALCLTQGAVWAKSGHGNGKDRDCGRNCERYDDHGRKSKHSRGDDHERDNKQRFANGHDNRRDHSERGAGPDRSFYRGERLPVYYRSPQYVVNNYHTHGLRVPPRGYHWVQTGGDYVLVAIATGIILELLLNR